MITYHENRPIPMPQLLELYDGWTAYTRDAGKMEKLLPGALWHLSAWDGDQAVGLIRTVGDDCSILYIQDIMVRPEYQRQGIGRELMSRAYARFAHIRQTVLMTDDSEETVAFYRACGMQLVTETGCVCFVEYNMDK